MKGILFKPDMIKAIVEGRKTQTRRLAGLEEINPEPDMWRPQVMEDGVWFFENPDGGGVIIKPRFHVGEVVYIKEAWDSDCTCDSPACNGVIYRLGYAGVIVPDKWRSPLFMPEKYARYFIKITGVRPERLQSITPEDCVKEGYPLGDIPDDRDEKQMQISRLMRLGWYQFLWNSINPKTPWSTNPWVWVYSFERIVEGVL